MLKLVEQNNQDQPDLIRHAAESRILHVNRNFNTSVHDVFAPRLYVEFLKVLLPPSHSLCLIQGKRSTAESKTNAFLNEA